MLQQGDERGAQDELVGCHCAEPAAARIAGCSATTHSGVVPRVALELCRGRQGRRIKPAALDEMADCPSAAADFCNKISKACLNCGDIRKR